MGAVRTGVLGGTFDPPHLGHLVLAAAARQQLNLDRVLFVPARLPWRKMGSEVSEAQVRLRMTEAAVAGFEWAVVSTLEIEREGLSYASVTMQALAADGGDWWFILGADALADLPNWYEPETLLEAARLAFAARDGATEVPFGVVAVLPGIEARIDRLAMPNLDVSSTALRAQVRAGQATEVLLPHVVRAVIDEAGLYRTA